MRAFIISYIVRFISTRVFCVWRKKPTDICRGEEPDCCVKLTVAGHLLSTNPFSFHLPLSPSRCYNKTNGTFSSGTLPVMHRMAPCQQDGLEMVPLGQVSSQCQGPDSHMHSGEHGADAGYQPDEHSESSPSQHSCCLVGNNENCPADNTGETHVHTKVLIYLLLLSLWWFLSAEMKKENCKIPLPDQKDVKYSQNSLISCLVGDF